MKKILITSLIFGLVSTQLVCSDLRQQWQQFLICAEEQSKQSNDAAYTTFKTMLADINTLQVLPLWRATVFYQKMRAQPIEQLSGDAKNTFVQRNVREFTQTYNAQTRSFMQRLIGFKNSIATINAQCKAPFTRLANVQQLWQQIRNELITPLTSGQFTNDFKNAPFIAQVAACDVMRHCVDTIDTMIKTVKTSNDIALAERKAQFRTMINEFNSLFTTWAINIMPRSAVQYHVSYPLEHYITEVQRVYNDIDTTDVSFQRSPNFSVNAAMLGSRTLLSRHFPQTFEDKFMLIHQNSLVVVAATYGSLFKDKPLQELIDLPEILQKTIQYIDDEAKYIARNDNMRRFTVSPKRIGINYSADTIEILYNMPLHNHSATFQVLYNQTTQQCTLAVQFLGENRNPAYRWEQIAFLAAISPDLSGLELTNNVVFGAQAVSWSWVIKQPTDIQSIQAYLAYMSVLSHEEDLETSKLQALHRNSMPFAQALQRACDNYKNRYSHFNNHEWVLRRICR